MAKTYYDTLVEEGVPETIPSDGFCFEDVYDEHIANNQKTWKQDRRLTVGASECFGCIRKTFFTKRGDELGIKRDEDYEENWGAMERGNVLENSFIVPAVEAGLRRRGMDLIMAGDGQDTILDGIHSATLDGLVIDAPRDVLSFYGIPDIGTDNFVLEMKTFDPRLEMKHEKPVHRGQTQMQMGLVRQTTDYKPEFAVLMYINASWLSDMRIFIVPYDDAAYRIGRKRNEKVFEEKDAGRFAPEGKMDGLCTYCDFKGACDTVTAARVPATRKALTVREAKEQDAEFIDDLEPLVLERDAIAKRQKEDKLALEAANEKVRQALIAAGTSRAVGENWKVTYTSQAGRKTLSKALMEAAGIDPDLYMTEGGSFEKLTVTVK